jgi:V8-like Glu-specific endopeptidase
MMRFLLLIFLYLSVLSCASHRKDYASLKLPKETPPGQALIVSSKGICNASLITPNTLLTNSHCLAKTVEGDTTAIIKTTQEDVVVGIKRIVYQSEYMTGHDYITANPDYAVLELEFTPLNVTPLKIKRTEFKNHQPVFLHSLEILEDLSIVLKNSKCFTFKTNWDSDYKSGLRNVFIHQGSGKSEDCIVKEGHSGSALLNEKGEMVGVLRQLKNQKVVDGRKTGNLGIATSMSCVDLFDTELDKTKDKRCDVEKPYDRKQEFVEKLKLTLNEEIRSKTQTLSPLFKYSAHSTQDAVEPKELIYKNTFRMEPDCIVKMKYPKGFKEGSLADFHIQVGITFDKFQGFGFATPKTEKISYPFTLRKVKTKDFDFVIDTPFVKGKPLPYCPS